MSTANNAASIGSARSREITAEWARWFTDGDGRWIAAALGVAYVGWIAFTTADRGVNAGVGVLVAWPALIGVATLVIAPLAAIGVLVVRHAREGSATAESADAEKATSSKATPGNSTAAESATGEGATRKGTSGKKGASKAAGGKAGGGNAAGSKAASRK